MATIIKDLGPVSAYAYAVTQGYTGTEEEFAQEMADLVAISAEAETLEPDEEATASYEGGVLSFGIPKGDKGDTGETGATGATGATGNGIASITKTGTAGLVDTYTITFTDGTTTTFDVTNGTAAIDDTLSIAGRAADAKATGDEIGNLKSDLTFKASVFQPVNDSLVAIYNKNRFDGKAIADCYLGSAGNLINNSNWSTTSLIYVGDLPSVVASKKVIATGDRSRLQMYFLCTYDENCAFIEQKSNNPERYTVESGVSYIRFSFHDSEHTDIQVESGTNRTEYVEYNYKGLEEKTETDLQNAVALLNNRYEGNLVRIDNSITNTDFVDITNQLTLYDGYIDNANGNLVAYNDAKSTDYLNIYEYGDLYVTGSALYASNCLFAIYDANQTFLGYHKNGTETNYHFRWFDVINDYSTAQFVRFSSITAVAALAIKRPSTINEILSDFSVEKWTGKKWVCIGDSLTEANSRTTKHYYDYVSEKTGITVITNAGSGSGYKNPSSVDNKTFYQRAAEIPTDADVITVFGSGNDLTHGYTLGSVTDTGTTTICGCINTTLDALIARIPAIQLGIVAPTPWVDFPPSTAGNAMDQYVEALKTICENRSIPFLDLYHCSNLRPWTAEGRTACYSKDNGNGVHPDETGHKLIASRFKGFLDFLLV